jgi:hypothetical protein
VVNARSHRKFAIRSLLVRRTIIEQAAYWLRNGARGAVSDAISTRQTAE